jgi:uncharacterized protein
MIPAEAGAMRIGVVSDTHGQMRNAMAAVRMLESLEVDAVLHCGDIGAVEIVPLFRAWPTHFVLGNVDGYNEVELQKAIESGGMSFHGRFADLQLGGRRIAVLHSDDAKQFRETVASGTWDLVCYGHTHEPEWHRVGTTLVLNPGALYRARRHTLAIVDLTTWDVQHIGV